MRVWSAALLLACLMISPGLPAANLDVDISGVSGELLQNVEAYLGALPESATARDRYVANAEARVRDALQALGFYTPAIAVSTDRTEKDWTLKIVVEPGEQVTLNRVQVSIDGAASEDPAFTDLLAAIPLQQGQPLHHGRYDEFKRQLQVLGQRRGYIEATLETSELRVDVAARSADITLHYDSGPRYAFGEVRIDEEKLSRQTLAPLLPFSEGEPFLQESLVGLRARLRQTGFFSGVIVLPRFDQARGERIPIDIDLIPAPKNSYEVGVGFSTDTRERVSLVWRTPRINRHGHSQETRLQWSPVNPIVRTTYSIPLTHPTQDTLQIKARLENNEFGDLDSTQKELMLRREIGGAWVYSYHARLLSEDWNVGPDDLTADYLLGGITLSRRERRVGTVDPREGFSQFYVAEGATESLGSDDDIVRLRARWTWVTSPGERHRIVARGEAGALLGQNRQISEQPPSLGFFAGGDDSLRGYGYQSIGEEVSVEGADGVVRTLTTPGNRLLLGSIEYQYYINQSWRVATFVDTGDAFTDSDFDFNAGVGFGVHYLTPVGAIRLELANSVTRDQPEWRFHINIGAEL